MRYIQAIISTFRHMRTSISVEWREILFFNILYVWSEWNMWNVHGILCASYVFKLRNSTCWFYLKNKSSHILYASQVQVSFLGQWMRGKSSTSTWLASRVFECIATRTRYSVCLALLQLIYRFKQILVILEIIHFTAQI